MNAKEFISNLFLGDESIKEKIKNIKFDYLRYAFLRKEITYDIIINFIDQYHNEIIESCLKDEQLINDLLCEDSIVDTRKRSTINKAYYEELIMKIKSKDFDKNSITLFLNIIGFYNLYSSKYDSNEMKAILNNNIYHIIKNNDLVSSDGDKIPSVDERLQITDKLISWSKRFGNKILDNICNLELLHTNIEKLLSIHGINQESQLLNLLRTCKLAIKMRDNNIEPSKEEIDQINLLFDTYEHLNREILIEILNNSDIILVHFVRDNKVNYQLVGNKIINVSRANINEFDNKQNSHFINTYIEFIKNLFIKETGIKLDINNPVHRSVLIKYLDKFNEIMNFKPLDRLPITIRETSVEFDNYIRESSSRLSCSLCSKDMVKSHLDRKVGLILMPKSESSIISTSIGYTSNKFYHDFKNDSAPCTDLWESVYSPKLVNETCVDAKDCEVIGVLLLGDDEASKTRAEELANSYNVEVISLNNVKKS